MILSFNRHISSLLNSRCGNLQRSVRFQGRKISTWEKNQTFRNLERLSGSPRSVSGFLTTTHRKRHTYTLVQCTLFFVCVYRHIHQNKNFTIAITFLLHKKENYFNCDPQFAKCWSSSAPVFQRSTFQSWPRALEPRAA